MIMCLDEPWLGMGLSIGLLDYIGPYSNLQS
jgi:hypothetical protein